MYARKLHAALREGMNPDNPTCRACLSGLLAAVLDIYRCEITAAEAAEIAGKSASQIRRMIQTGALEAHYGPDDRLRLRLGDLPMGRTQRLRVFAVLREIQESFNQPVSPLSCTPGTG